MKTLTWTLVVCGSVVAAGCGQKGALYLPDKNASVVTRPAGSNAPPAAPSTPQQPQDKSKSDDDSPKQIHGHTGLEAGWTITPALILAVVGVFTVANIGKLDALPKGDNVMKVTVIGHQWWWEYDYADTGVITANELHIPVGKVIDVRITSKDVIHSFWPPKLAGKLDAVPGHLNHMQIKTEADDAGKTFWGQCAEYCGLSHANMRLKVVVHSPEDYAKWEQGQVASANMTFADGSTEKSGMELFRSKGCGGCHTLAAANSGGTTGPDLDEVLPGQSDAEIEESIVDPNAKIAKGYPPSVMPENFKETISSEEIKELVEFLSENAGKKSGGE